ncbi:methyl-accepting chemotaxis protein [Tissierella sp. Yu-01]|uniref:methyl-accepting chemotaxis protein n=1 Tax=Tissierella sp. Yu-01 TaxID=3035694 RepID=UPI00240E02DB|nr:methyl-accepting chemotaxis protein [Tissierella sp. Yu-01]WFA08280.1 methyl-accepting chemotaxis protein [Tissierella sp. Yu-01]
MKLKNKIILFTTLVCILSILFISGVNYLFSITELEKEVNNKVQLEAKNIAQEIDGWIALQKRSLSELIDGMVVANNFDYEYACDFLVAAKGRNPGNHYYAALEDQTYLHPDRRVIDYDPTERGWYVGAKDIDDFYISDPYVDSRTGSMVISIAKSFEIEDGRKGVISTDIQIDYLVDMIAKVNIAENSYAFLSDNNGNIITHINDEYKPLEDKTTNIKDILNGEFVQISQAEGLDLYDRNIIDYDGLERYFFSQDVAESDWNVGVAVSEDYAIGTVNNVFKYTIIGTIVVLIIATVMSLYISHSITKPIIHSASLAEEIGNLNLTNEIDTKELKRKDEIGQMYNSFNNIIVKLKLFMKDMDSSIVTNHDVYLKTLDELRKLTELAEETSATTEELSASMEETAASTTMVTEAASNIDKAIVDFAEKIEKGAYTSNEISSKADNLSDKFIQAKQNTMEIYSSTKEEIQNAITSAKDVNKINVLSNAILEISEQTSLLSLNAAIEAARAGESGRGFAVVADEIRKLAEGSNKSVIEIQNVANDITKAVNQLIDNTSNLIGFLENDILQDYEMMVSAVLDYKADGSSLNDMISDLSATSEELSATVSNISTSMADVSITVEDSNLATMNIAEKNMNIVQAIENINSVMEKNKEVSEKLEKIVSQVKY